MSKVRSVVRKFILPVACIATVGWAFGFSVMYATIPKRDLGVSLLLAFTGILLLAPWLLMALSVFQRMRANSTTEAGRKDLEKAHE